MRRARHLATALLGLALALTAAPSADAGPPLARWDGLDEGDYLAELPLTGSAADPDAPSDGSGGGIVSVTYDLQPEVPEEPGDPCTATVDEDERHQTYDEPDPSVELELPATIPCNRRYIARATITTRPVGPPADVQPETTILEAPIAVAVPPDAPDGIAAVYAAGDPDDAEDNTVRVTWDPNEEPDIVGYVVHRSAPGAGSYVEVAEVEDTEWVDTDVVYGGSYGYRVDAVRQGPDHDVEEDGEVMTVRSERPTGVVLDVPGPPPTTSTTSTTAPAEAPAAGGGGARPIRRPVSRPASPPTTVDTGFEDELDYGAEAAASPEPGEGEPQVIPEPVGGDAAVVATFDDDEDHDRKAVLAPVAGGLALLVGALQLRLLTRRAAQPA